MGRVVLMGALAVGNLDRPGQLRLFLPGNVMAWPQIIVVGDMAMVEVFRNGGPGPFLQPALFIQQIARQRVPLSLPMR